MNYKTISELFLNTVKEFGDKELFYYKKGRSWSAINGKTIHYTVSDIANALLSKGLKKGDRVGIISTNSPKWAMADYGIICSGCATVSIYPTLIASQIEYIIKDSGLKILFLENEEQLEKIQEIWKNCPSLEFIVMLNDSFVEETDKVFKFTTFLDLGMEHSRANEGSFENAVNDIDENDLLTLIYTSGTTGNPKGVMLSHKNLISNISATLKAQKFDKNEVFLSFLPLSHVFERMAGHFSAFSIGATTYYAESIETVADNMGEAKPTILVSVPRLYEKIHAKIIDGVNNAPKIRKSIFYWSLNVGKKYSMSIYNGLKVSPALKIKHKIANKLVFQKAQNRFGGRLKFFISGGAPLSKELAEFFFALDLLILEGYGLTETSPVLTCNTPDSFRFGTVGKSLYNVEVKIADDGEIMAKGPNIMLGYYKKEEKTKQVLNNEGWFCTGDIGVIDRDGFLKITDRKKSLIVTSAGKNIAPAPIENKLLNSVYIDQALIIGDRRNFISALIVPNFEALKAYLENQGVEITSNDAMVDHKKTLNLIDGIIENAMKDFSKYETVKKYKLLSAPWTLDKGEITPSLKVVRKKVENNYIKLIDSIYN